MKIAKGDPPGRFQYEGWDAIKDAAMEVPNEWVTPDREYPHSVVTALQRGKNSILPPNEFEFRTSETRYDIEGRRFCRLHIRYTPKENNA